MENFEIITDSSANLQKSLLDIYHIHILTLRFSRRQKGSTDPMKRESIGH